MSGAARDIPVGALATARAVRAGEVRARQVAEAALARIETFEGELHCFNTVTADAALAAADGEAASGTSGEEVEAAR